MDSFAQTTTVLNWTNRRIALNKQHANENVIPEMLTTEEAAAALHKQTQTLRTWSSRGSGPISPVRLGRRGRLLWRKSDIIAILSGEVDALENMGTQNAEI